MQEKDYINKKEALKRGYIRRTEGGYYKKSVLEKYFDGGYLKLSDSNFSAEDRKKVGEQLAKDFYLGNYHNLQSVKLFADNIRSTGSYSREEALFYKERYLNAIRAIPAEFWPAVRCVCIEDKELFSRPEIPKNSLLHKNNIYHQKMLLCLGLERFIKFYLQKNKKKT